MRFKQICSGIFQGHYRRSLFCTCIALFLAVPAAFGGDSIPARVPLPPADSSATRVQNEQEEQAYWKPEHFKDIPVEEAVEGRKTDFETLRHKYDAPEFDYSEQVLDRLSWWDRLKRRVNAFLRSILPEWSISSTTLVLRILAILGICALIFIIYRLIASGRKIFVRETRERQEAAADLIEQNLETTDIRAYLEAALAKKDYTLAIRYLHLINLQALAKKNIIDWDHRKTNHDFLLEIQAPLLREAFERTSMIYEYIWFGNFTIDESQFLSHQALFVQFKNHIG